MLEGFLSPVDIDIKVEDTSQRYLLFHNINMMVSTQRHNDWEGHLQAPNQVDCYLLQDS